MLKEFPRFSPFLRGLFISAVGWVATLSFAATEKWIKVQAGHFTILTPSSETNARKWAAELQQFEIGLQNILPVPEQRLRPVTVVLFRSDKALRPFKPLEKGKPQEIAGFFVQVMDSHAIAVALDYDAEDIRSIIYHEAVHWYTSAADKPLPPWLDEGLAEVYSTFRRKEDGQYTFGEARREHLAMVQNGKMLPLAKLASVTHGSLEYNDRDRATMFYSESWALVHYLLFGRDTPGMDSIVRYVDAMKTASSVDAAFQSAFAADCGEMDARLAKYVRGGYYRIYSYKLPDGANGEKLAVVPAPEGEVQLALGTLLLGSRGENTAEVDRYLQRAAALSPDNAEVWQVHGEIAMKARDYTAASEHFARAARAGSGSYIVYYGLGWTRLHEQYAAGGYFDSGELNRAAADLRRAIELNPQFVSAYEALASVLYNLDSLDPKDRARMESGRVLAPDNAMIDVGLSACDFKSGETALARQRLELVLAAEGGSQQQAKQIARMMLTHDDWGRVEENLDRLFREKRYAEAVAAIDEASARFDDKKYRQVLTTNRRMAEAARRINEALELVNSGRDTEGRAMLEKMMAENPAPDVRGELQRILQELDSPASAVGKRR